MKRKTASIFWTGRSQAVRLPKEFRFEGDRLVAVQVDGEWEPVSHLLVGIGAVPEVSLAQAAGLEVDTLSMGMSHDFEAALQEGATMVRIGTAIFGSRSPLGEGRGEGQ